MARCSEPMRIYYLVVSLSWKLHSVWPGCVAGESLYKEVKRVTDSILGIPSQCMVVGRFFSEVRLRPLMLSRSPGLIWIESVHLEPCNCSNRVRFPWLRQGDFWNMSFCIYAITLVCSSLAVPPCVPVYYSTSCHSKLSRSVFCFCTWLLR